MSETKLQVAARRVTEAAQREAEATAARERAEEELREAVREGEDENLEMYAAMYLHADGVGVAVFRREWYSDKFSMMRAGLVQDPSKGRLRGLDSVIATAVAVRCWVDEHCEVWPMLVFRDDFERQPPAAIAAITAMTGVTTYDIEYVGDLSLADPDDSPWVRWASNCDAVVLEEDRMEKKEWGLLSVEVRPAVLEAVKVGFAWRASLWSSR